MLDDKTFLGAVRALHDAADRLGQQTVTIQTNHLRRLLEMAERRHAEHDHDNDRVRVACDGRPMAGVLRGLAAEFVLRAAARDAMDGES